MVRRLEWWGCYYFCVQVSRWPLQSHYIGLSFLSRGETHAHGTAWTGAVVL